MDSAVDLEASKNGWYQARGMIYLCFAGLDWFGWFPIGVFNFFGKPLLVGYQKDTNEGSGKPTTFAKAIKPR